MRASEFRKLLVYLITCLAFVSAGSTLHGQADAPVTGQTGESGQHSAQQIHPRVGFALQKVGSRYEPVVRYEEAFRLPGTSMRFATFTYFTPEDEEMGLPKFGFLRDDGRFFYVDEHAAAYGDVQYALTDHYFIVDGGAGGSGNCRSMYLFTYDKDSIRLVDRIEETYEVFSPPGFMSDYPGKPAYGHEITYTMEHKETPVWIIDEKDRRGHPLIRLRMIRDLPNPFLGPEEFEVFHIYLKIVDGRLRVALDPDLYETLFNSLGEAGGRDARSTEYYVSGFLSGKLSLARIKAELAGNKERLWLVDCLRHVKRWDEALHRRYGHPLPKIVEYKLKGR